jgi:hypothetical protein
MLAQTKISYSKLELQMELEHLYNKNQLLPRIKQEFLDCTEFNFLTYMAEHEIPEDFGLDLLVQIVLHKRTTLSVLVGILRKHFEPAGNASQLAADMLYRCAEVDLVSYDEITERFIIEFDIDADVQEELARYQFPLPMVVEPQPVVSNSQNGYFTCSGSVILKKNHHHEDVCLDHINRMNRICFTLDDDTAFMIANEWRNLDKPKEGESHDDFQKRLRAFEKYDTTSKDVIKKITSMGNEFYLTHKYDKRGRTYCQGYHVNYMGTAWNKAVVQLLDKEFVE